MLYQVTHRTLYEYTEPVSVSHHAARLEPRAMAGQSCEACTLRIDPEPAVRTTRTDYFGNRVCYFATQQLHARLEVTATSRVEVDPLLAPAPDASAPWEEVAAMFRDPVPLELLDPHQFVFDSPQVRAVPEHRDYARAVFAPGRPVLEAARALARRIHTDFTFDPTATTVATPLEVVMRTRRGVCQDFAHLGVACLRALGLPARYVSGYLRTRPAPGRERLRGVDASHAWLSVFCPGWGWLDLDPTNDCVPAGEHITVAYGRDFSDVSPLLGILLGGGPHKVKVEVDVDPVA